MMGQVTVQAWYEASPVHEYAGNPLIEALPPIWSEEDAAERLAEMPLIPEEERSLPKEIRLHCINRLSHLIQPLPIHLELEAAVSSIFRGGYTGRNPMDSATWRHLHALKARDTHFSTFNSTASTFSLVGLSGMGKTTALMSILRHYPQVIKHTRYHGRDFIHTQIVWLKLECPFDGALEGLCQSFFQAVDKALGDDTYATYYKFKRRLPDLISGMEQVASTFFLGGLFIDELQHLRQAKLSGRDNMLNFFVNLINSLGVPVVFVGTNSMIELFSDIVRNARRVSGQGIYDFKQPLESDETWSLLLERMWEYQWVRDTTPLSESLRRTIYDLSQGVTDFLAKLMILGQRHAIQSGVERLDERIFEHVAATKMKLLQPAILALRSRDPRQMAKFEDLLPADAQLSEMMSGKLHVVADRLSLLRTRHEQKLSVNSKKESPVQEGPSATRVAAKVAPIQVVPHAGEGRAPADQVDRVRSAPLSASLVGAVDTMEKLREAGWVLSDPFEFEPAYRAA